MRWRDFFNMIVGAVGAVIGVALASWLLGKGPTEYAGHFIISWAFAYMLICAIREERDA